MYYLWVVKIQRTIYLLPVTHVVLFLQELEFIPKTEKFKIFEKHYPAKLQEKKGYICILVAGRATKIVIISVAEKENTILNIILDVNIRIGKR